MRVDLLDMANAIARTKVEVAAINAPDGDHSRLGIALDAIVHTTEQATSDILGAAEHVQEVAWTLREAGSEDAVCDELDRMATRIYTACSFQDITAQRTARIIHTLRYLEERLAAMMAIWGDELGAMRAQSDEAGDPAEELCQGDVDRFIDMESPVAAAAAPKPELPDVQSLDDEFLFLEGPQEEDAASTVAFLDMAADPEPAAAEMSVDPAPSESGEDETAMEDAEEIAGPAQAIAEPPVDDEEWPEGTDIETAFAEIDEMTPEQKAVLFS
jgi:hypothetical protein